jgi:hypothetical protein
MYKQKNEGKVWIYIGKYEDAMMHAVSLTVLW